MIRRINILFFILLAVLTAAPARADIAALSYSDPAGQARTVAPVHQYINPAGGLDLYLSAGLDRKVGYILKDSAGAPVAAGVSELVTGADTFTVLGQTYYGKILSIPATVAEGNYTLTGQILDGAGNVVASREYPLVVDRTGPTAGEWWRRLSYSDKAFVDNDLLTGTYIYSVWLKNVSDLSGVAAVQFESYDPATGTVLTSKAAWYNDATREAGIGSGYSLNLVGNNFLPSRDGPLGIRFVLTDRAGNQNVLSKTVKFDGHRNPLPELVAVRNPSVTTEFIPGSGLVGYEAYTPGMTVHENPMKFLYRLPRSNWQTDNPDYGVYIWTRPNINESLREPPVLYQDGIYVYFDVTVPYSAINTYQLWTYTNSSTYSIGLSFNVKMAAAATQSPKWLGMSYNRSDSGWTPEFANGTYILFNDPALSVTQMKVRVEPRPYDQVFYCGFASCTIPAGETECTAPVNVSKPAAGNNGGYSANHTLRSTDGSLYTWGGASGVLYDFSLPQILSCDPDRINKKATFVVYNLHETNSYYWQLASYGLAAINAVSGQQVTINGALTARPGLDNMLITVDYNSLPDGDWQFSVFAQDRAGNRGTLDVGQVVLDRTPPAVQFYKEAAALTDHGETDSLGKVRFKVTDSVDTSPQVESVRFTGGPQNSDVYLAYHVQDGAYVLEYPVLSPSAGQDYVLAVTVKDASGNRATRTLSFAYEPPSVQLTSGGQATLNLPAIPAPVVHTDGASALVSQPIAVNGSPLSGTYDLTVIASADSTAPVVVDGHYLAPGEMATISGYSFRANNGRLNLPVWSAQEGRARLVVTSMAPDFPVLRAEMRFWKPQIELTASPGWAVQPLIEPQALGAKPMDGTPCAVTLDPREAQKADPIDGPQCLVEFLKAPPGYRVQGNSLAGLFAPDDSLEVEYQVSVYNGGVKHILATGNRLLAAKPISDIALTPSLKSGAQYFRRVQPVALSLASTGRFNCKLYSSEDRVPLTDQAACVVRWTQQPEGMAAGIKAGVLEGRLNNQGVNTATWAVDLYHRKMGMVRNVASGSVSLTAVEPPALSVAFEPGRYAAPLGDAYVTTDGYGEAGYLRFQAPAAQVGLTVTQTVDGKTASRNYTAVGNKYPLSHPVLAGPLGLWEARTVKLRLAYTDLPEMGVEQDIQVVGAPSRQVAASLTAPREAINTDGVPLQVRLLPPAGEKRGYEATRDGAWEVQFGAIGGDRQFQGLTGWSDLPPDGVLSGVVPGLSHGTAKLAAQLRVKAPAGLAAYSRTVLSNPVNVAVISGEAPDGQLATRRLSGPAPLSTVIDLRLSADNRRLLGESGWQISRDNGATWEALPGQTPTRAIVTVAAGTHLVRAQVANRLTGAAAYTEALELYAYNVPTITVQGPAAVLVGTPVGLKAQLSNGGEVLQDKDAVVEWYELTGKQPFHTGPEISVETAKVRTLAYRLRARFKEAPADDLYSWGQQTAYVRVMAPQRPRVVIEAPTVMEYDEANPRTYRIRAGVALSPGLEGYTVSGEWLNPDGTAESGWEKEYRPTAQDGARRHVVLRYRAWVEGYKDLTLGTYVKTVPLAPYVWPEFALEAKPQYQVAPSVVKLSAWPRNLPLWRLESPEYIWRLPVGAAIVRTLDNGRTVYAHLPEPGNYELGVQVTDARGSAAEAEAEVVLEEPPPFTVSFQPIYSNPEKREPLDVWLRPRATGGHPGDAITDWQISADDPKAAVLPGYRIVRGLTAGGRTIHVKGMSKHGKLAEADLSVAVAVNQPPQCRVEASADDRYVLMRASCTDPDGRVVSQRWYRDGRVVSTGKAIRVNKAEAAGIRFVAIDDGGAVYDAEVKP